MYLLFISNIALGQLFGLNPVQNTYMFPAVSVMVSVDMVELYYNSRFHHVRYIESHPWIWIRWFPT